MKARIENGQIIIDELDPMSAAPKDGTIVLGKLWDYTVFSETYFDVAFDSWIIDDEFYGDGAFEGQIPMPITRC